MEVSIEIFEQEGGELSASRSAGGRCYARQDPPELSILLLSPAIGIIALNDHATIRRDRSRSGRVTVLVCLVLCILKFLLLGEYMYIDGGCVRIELYSNL